MKTKRSKRSTGVILCMLLSVGLLSGSTGCSGAEEFRAATADTFQSALTTFATGLVDGLAAVYTPDATSSDSTTTQ